MLLRHPGFGGMKRVIEGLVAKSVLGHGHLKVVLAEPKGQYKCCGRISFLAPKIKSFAAGFANCHG